jgi:hypothetical protein
VNSEDQILNNQEDKDNLSPLPDAPIIGLEKSISEKSLPQTEKTLDINLKFIIC